MNSKKILALLVCFAAVFVSTVVLAAVSQESNFWLDTLAYESNSDLNGKLSLALTNENADSNFVATANSNTNEMILLDFLKANNASYSCSPLDCNPYFTIASSSSAADVTKESFVGFSITEANSVDINEIKFDLSPSSGNAFASSCGTSQLKMDFLNDNVADWKYLEAAEFLDSCSALVFGKCYTASLADKEYEISYLTPYCQPILLNMTSKVKLASYIKKENVNTTGKIEMLIRDPDTREESETCEINTANVATSYPASPLSCSVNYTVKKSKEYEICIKGDSGFRIKGEETSPICGFAGTAKGARIDFAILAQIAPVKEFSSVTFDDNAFNENTESSFTSLSEYANNYLSKIYKKNCTAECLIPVKINAEQPTHISNVFVKYTSGGAIKLSDKIYVFEKNSALLNMSRQNLSLSALQIKSPFEQGSHKLYLKIGSTNLKPTTGAEFKVEAMPKILNLVPLNVSSSIETAFFVSVAAMGKIIKNYEFNFGDGSSVVKTNSSSAKHKYSSAGIYNVTIDLLTSDGLKSSNTFAVSVSAPKELVKSMIDSKKSALENIDTALSGIPLWCKSMIISKEEELASDLAVYEEDYNAATEDKDYEDIKKALDAIPIPVSIADSATFSESDIALNSEKISLNYLETASGSAYSKEAEDETKNAVLAWMSENIKIKLSGSVKKAVNDDSTEKLLTIYRIKVIPEKSVSNVYLIIPLPSGVDYSKVKFAQEYGQQNADGAVAIKFGALSKEETIELAMPNEQEFLLDVYASPSFDEIEVASESVSCGNQVCEKSLGENTKTCPEDCPRSIFVQIGLIVLGTAVGIFLIWRVYAAIYERMEQHRIYKTRKNYISVLIFIADAFKRGMEEIEIIEKLRGAGWNEEQISYAMKKSKRAEKKVTKTLSKQGK